MPEQKKKSGNLLKAPRASRKEGGRGFTGVDASIQGLEDYIKKNKERLITVISYITDYIRSNRNITKTRKY